MDNRKSYAIRTSIIDAAFSLGAFGTENVNWEFDLNKPAIDVVVDNSPLTVDFDTLLRTSEETFHDALEPEPELEPEHEQPRHVDYFPPPPEVLATPSKKTRKTKANGYDSDGGYISDGWRKLTRKKKAKPTADQVAHEDANADDTGYTSENSRKKKKSKKSTEPPSHERSLLSVDSSSSLQPSTSSSRTINSTFGLADKGDKKERKSRSSSPVPGAESDGGYMSEASTKKKRSFFGLRTKSPSKGKSSHKESSDGYIPPVPAMPSSAHAKPTPIADKFVKTHQAADSGVDSIASTLVPQAESLLTPASLTQALNPEIWSRNSKLGPVTAPVRVMTHDMPIPVTPRKQDSASRIADSARSRTEDFIGRMRKSSKGSFSSGSIASQTPITPSRSRRTSPDRAPSPNPLKRSPSLLDQKQLKRTPSLLDLQKQLKRSPSLLVSQVETSSPISPVSLGGPATPKPQHDQDYVVVEPGPDSPSVPNERKRDSLLAAPAGLWGSRNLTRRPSLLNVAPPSSFLGPSPQTSPVASTTGSLTPREITSATRSNILAAYHMQPPPSPPPVGPLPSVPKDAPSLEVDTRYLPSRLFIERRVRSPSPAPPTQDRNSNSDSDSNNGTDQRGLFTQPIPRIRRGRESPFPEQPILPREDIRHLTRSPSFNPNTPHRYLKTPGEGFQSGQSQPASLNPSPRASHEASVRSNSPQPQSLMEEGVFEPFRVRFSDELEEIKDTPILEPSLFTTLKVHSDAEPSYARQESVYIDDDDDKSQYPDDESQQAHPNFLDNDPFAANPYKREQRVATNTGDDERTPSDRYTNCFSVYSHMSILDSDRSAEVRKRFVKKVEAMVGSGMDDDMPPVPPLPQIVKLGRVTG